MPTLAYAFRQSFSLFPFSLTRYCIDILIYIIDDADISLADYADVH
jgi:hypothetical protein